MTAESEELMEYENVKAEEILSDTVLNIAKQKSKECYEINLDILEYMI